MTVQCSVSTVPTPLLSGPIYEKLTDCMDILNEWHIHYIYIYIDIYIYITLQYIHTFCIHL